MDVLTAVLALGVAGGYFTIAALIVPRIHLEEATPRFTSAFRLGGIAFFVGCGLTHTHIAYHALVDEQEVGIHEAVFHLLQVFGVWVFIYAALRFLEVRIARRKTAAELQAEELRGRVEALSRSNQDLEQFAHVVAHDLQEPLRSISGFATLLERDADGRLDARGVQSVRFIREGSVRMSRLLDGVLAYSRAAGVGLRREPVDLGEVLGSVRAGLGRTIGERRAEVTAEPLPVVVGDRVQLEQLMQNVVGNAIKFGGAGGEPPRVHVSAEVRDGVAEVAVRDNGPGIDPRDGDRVFEMFRRGRHESGEPGSGVGLAVAATIAGRHGGRLWHEPAEGGGTVFRFTLVGAAAAAAAAEAAERPVAGFPA